MLAEGAAGWTAPARDGHLRAVCRLATTAAPETPATCNGRGVAAGGDDVDDVGDGVEDGNADGRRDPRRFSLPDFRPPSPVAATIRTLQKCVGALG